MPIYQILKIALRRSFAGSIPILFGATLLVITLSTITVYFAERGINDDFKDLGDCLWWILVTISTVGYGDKVPITLAGRAVAFIAMVAGPVLLVTLLGSFGTLFYDEWQKGVKGMSQITSKGHILICGWNATAMDVINELRDSDTFKRTPITIIDDTIDTNPVKSSVATFIHGNPSDVKALQKANVRKAKYAIVLAKNPTAIADQQTVLTVLAIEDINPQIHTCAELNDSANEGHVRRAGCDVIVNTNLLTSKLLALSLQNPVANKVITELASFRGNEIYRIQTPSSVAESSFSDLLTKYKQEHDAIIIGIDRDGETIINPPLGFKTKIGDGLLLISEHAPMFGAEIKY